MKILLGIGYDERLPNKPIERIGTLVCGEKGLISALEFRAGKKTLEVSQAARTVAYLKALKAADNSSRFYSKSLAVDAMASAESLLGWRDWAMLHGWQNDIGSTNHGRMQDLAEVEHHFNKPGLSLGERIYALLPHLHLLSADITAFELHHIRASWPPLYQYLFNELEKTGIAILEAAVETEPQAEQGTDLGLLQHALCNEQKERISLKLDGSLKLFSTANTQLTAQYAVQAATDQTLIISKNLNHCLETAIGLQAGNHSGVGDMSGSRAPNQLLFLMLQSAWKTPSANALLQFLTLPAGRFKTLRNKIARSFRDLPGIHREKWEILIDEYITKLNTEQPGHDETSLRNAIHDWLPVSICLSDDNMPVSIAVAIADRVATYWRNLMVMSEQEQNKVIFSAAFASADAITEALREWPDNTIDKMQLNRLMSIALNIGNSRYCHERDVSKFDVVTTPEVIKLSAVTPENIIWLEPEVNSLNSAPPLSKEELSGIPLAPTLEQQTFFMQQALLRAATPLFAARKTLTLIATDLAPELLKLQLTALLGNNIWQPLEEAILSAHSLDIATEKLTRFSLPYAKRWTHIKSPISAPRATESYSSLATLALKPHEYVLKYAAQFYEGTIESLTTDSRLLGNLAHRLVEAWIHAHPWTGRPIASVEISDWLKKYLPLIIQQIALPLAQPGKQVERMRFEEKMLASLDALFKAMVAANIRTVHPERNFTYVDSICQLTSEIDLFCELDDGRFAIIDMKWGSYEKYRGELKAGRPLQLATYAYIAERSPTEPAAVRVGQFADAGYFILSRAELLCTNNLTFPTATVVQPDELTSFKLTWQQLEKTLRWRLAQLHQGQIEFTYGTPEADGNSEPTTGALDLLTLEQSVKKGSGNSYKATFKAVDSWRNLTGNIKDI